MARPKYRKGDNTAREKLEAAFWDALAKEPYESMSVVGLCKVAGVNKNTFYYHFNNIDELARFAADHLMEPRFLTISMEMLKGNIRVFDDIPEEAVATRFDRICLLAGDNTPTHLRCILHNAVLKMWETQLGIHPDKLSLQERASLEFVLSGLLGIFALRSREGGSFSPDNLKGAAYLPHAYELIETLIEACK